MPDTRSQKDRDAARNRAQQHFTASEQRDVHLRQTIETERAATDAKTAKLRALRLAKEEADRVAAASAPQAPVAERVRKPRAKKA